MISPNCQGIVDSDLLGIFFCFSYENLSRYNRYNDNRTTLIAPTFLITNDEFSIFMLELLLWRLVSVLCGGKNDGMPQWRARVPFASS